MPDSARTVILLGAGASRASDFTLPTLKGFFGTSLDALADNLRAFLQWFYPGLPPERFDLEELLSFLDLAETRLSRWTSSQRPAQYAGNVLRYQDLIAYVRHRLGIPTRGLCEKHVRLLDRFGPKATVATLNYDLVADNALLDSDNRLAGDTVSEPYSRVGKVSALLTPRVGRGSSRPPFLLPKEFNYGFYLKLHGSLDWLTCTEPTCRNASRFYSLTFERPIVESQASYQCRLCGAPMDTYIVPPVVTKPRETQGPMRMIWSMTFDRLRAADRVVVIGVSFAPSDVELRWLVRQSSELRTRPIDLDVVNPSDEHRQAARLLFGSVDRFRTFQSFEEYLASDQE